MAPIRYRRTSLRTMLGITKEEKQIKRELGITALLRPFRWWGNEKRDVKRELGYYSPTAKLARHVLPHRMGRLFLLLLVVLATPFALGWLLGRTGSPPENETEPAPRATERLDADGKRLGILLPTSEWETTSLYTGRIVPKIVILEEDESLLGIEPAVAIEPAGGPAIITTAAIEPTPAPAAMAPDVRQSLMMMVTPRVIFDDSYLEEHKKRMGIETAQMMQMVTPRIISGESEEEDRLGIAAP